MKSVLALIAPCMAIAIGAHAQTTLSNIDQDAITDPNQTSTNLRMWGYSTGSGVGCGSLCTPSGSLSHTSYYSVNGQSLQLNLANPSDCTTNCYGDLDFSDRLYQNNATASNATDFTLDLYVTMDSLGNANSQALEFTIEQDVPSTETSGDWDRYIYSWQCNYKGSTTAPGANGGLPTGGIWNVWDGAANSGQGGWVAAVTTSGSTVPCGTYTAGQFVHYYFHFLRLPSTRQIQFTDFTMVNSAGTSTYYQFDQVEGIQNPQPDWQTGLFTALQLDGDYSQSPYSVWADEWKVAYQ